MAGAVKGRPHQRSGQLRDRRRGEHRHRERDGATVRDLNLVKGDMQRERGFARRGRQQGKRDKVDLRQTGRVNSSARRLIHQVGPDRSGVFRAGWLRARQVARRHLPQQQRAVGSRGVGLLRGELQRQGHPRLPLARVHPPAEARLQGMVGAEQHDGFRIERSQARNHGPAADGQRHSGGGNRKIGQVEGVPDAAAQFQGEVERDRGRTGMEQVRGEVQPVARIVWPRRLAVRLPMQPVVRLRIAPAPTVRRGWQVDGLLLAGLRILDAGLRDPPASLLILGLRVVEPQAHVFLAVLRTDVFHHGQQIALLLRRHGRVVGRVRGRRQVGQGKREGEAGKGCRPAQGGGRLPSSSRRSSAS